LVYGSVSSYWTVHSHLQHLVTTAYIRTSYLPSHKVMTASPFRLSFSLPLSYSFDKNRSLILTSTAL